ncbi:MAG: site-specific integrase [Cyanobacteria bacterium P01_E01_bin.42]
MKIDGHGQAAIISLEQWQKLKRKIKNPKYQLLFAIAWFTGERLGAILQLQVGDVYANPQTREPHQTITFRRQTRKGGKAGKAETRQVPIDPRLAVELKAFSPPATDGYLFPGRSPGAYLTFQAASQYLKRVLAKAGLSGLGITTHSWRRTFITYLCREGADYREVKELTGHRDWNSFERYIQSDPKRKQKTLSLLPG